MSLIFKALQKFQQPGRKLENHASESTVRQKGYSFRKIFMSPYVIFGAVAVMIIMGLAASQLTHYFSKKRQLLTPTAEAALSDQPESQGDDSVTNREMEQLPEPGSDPSQSPEPAQSPKPASPITYQVHPPKTDPDKSGLLVSEKATPTIKDSVESPTHDPIGQQAQVPESLATQPLDEAWPHESAAPSTRVIPPREDQSMQREPAPARLDQQAAVAPRPLPGWTAPDAFVSGQSEYDTASSIVDKGKQPRSKTRLQDQQRQAEQATRHLEVARLVRRILSAIQADDVKTTSQLIQQLTRVKGSAHPFVSKLKAYSLIRQDRLDEAKILLSKVLAQSADDFEAGLNMAVIDIKLSHYDKARQRLEHLQECYPEKDRVAYYLGQLPR